MKAGAEFVVGRGDPGKFMSVAVKGLTWSMHECGSWHALDHRRNCQHASICYRNFRRAADKAIPPGKRALVRITVEVLKVLDD